MNKFSSSVLDTGASTTLYKTLIIGDSGVGKTCLLQQYVDKVYSHTFVSTVGIDFKKKVLNIKGCRVTLQIWDTAGNERFRTITASYYRGSHGAVLVYDITQRKTFENVEIWIESLRENTQINPELVLVGNKCDLESYREVSKKEGRDLAKKYNIPFFETSAALNIFVDKTFLALATNCYKRSKTGGYDENDTNINSFKFRELVAVLKSEQDEENTNCAKIHKILSTYIYVLLLQISKDKKFCEDGICEAIQQISDRDNICNCCIEKISNPMDTHHHLILSIYYFFRLFSVVPSYNSLLLKSSTTLTNLIYSIKDHSSFEDNKDFVQSFYMSLLSRFSLSSILPSSPFENQFPFLFCDYDDTIVNDSCSLFGYHAYMFENNDIQKEKKEIFDSLIDIYSKNYQPYSDEIKSICSSPSQYNKDTISTFMSKYNDYQEKELIPIINSNFHLNERKEVESMISRLVDYKCHSVEVLKCLNKMSSLYILSTNWFYNAVCNSLIPTNIQKEQIYCSHVSYDENKKGTGKVEGLVRSGRDKVNIINQLVASSSPSSPSIYIGDSISDLTPLLHVNIPIIYGNNNKLITFASLSGYTIASIYLLPYLIKDNNNHYMYQATSWDEIASVLLSSSLYPQYIKDIQQHIIKNTSKYITKSPVEVCRLMALTSDKLNDEVDEELSLLNGELNKTSDSNIDGIITKGEADVYRAVEGGATMVQLRDKTNGIDRMVRLSLRLHKYLQDHHVPLIIDDRVDVAIMSNADGVHIGQSDLPPLITRKLIGEDKILGVSCNTPEEAHVAELANVDYIGTGAIYPTNSKYDAEITGLDGLYKVVHSVDIPVVSIGGVNAANCHESIAQGAVGIAVISAIFGRPDVKEASQEIITAIHKALKENNMM
ncbi:hypothetical protein WA158_004992 [Blastocystis sp. Blastoise]